MFVALLVRMDSSSGDQVFGAEPTVEEFLGDATIAQLKKVVTNVGRMHQNDNLEVPRVSNRLTATLVDEVRAQQRPLWTVLPPKEKVN